MPIPGGSRATRKLSFVGRISIDKRASHQCLISSRQADLSGLIPPTSAKNDCTRRSRTWYTGVPRRVFYVFNFVKLRLAVRCRARQKVGCLNSLREV